MYVEFNLLQEMRLQYSRGKKAGLKKGYFSNAYVFKYIATNFAAYQIRPCIQSQIGRQIRSAQFYSLQNIEK